MEIKVAGLGEFLGAEQKYRMLVAGVPGSGKTPWAAQWPKPLFLAVDKSCAPSLAITRTPHIECKNDRDVIQALDFVEANQGRPSFEYQTLVLDTVSVLQERVAQDIMRRAGRRDLADVEGGWGQQKAAVRAVMDRLVRIDRLHVIVLCHMKDKHDVKEVELDLSGAMKGDLPKDFSFIGHLYMDWKDAEAKTDDAGAIEREPVRRITWKANPRFPILRNPGGILSVTAVDFRPSDYDQILEGMSSGLKALEPEPLDSKVVGEVPEVSQDVEPAPPDVPGGPVEPNVPRPRTKGDPSKFDPSDHNVVQVNAYLAENPDEVAEVLRAEAAGKARQGILQGTHAVSEAPAVPEVTEPAPAPQEGSEAVQAVQEILGGEVVSEETDPIMAVILTIKAPEEGTELWRQYKDAGWTSEHTAAMKERLALLATGGV